jgi:hypothetical protein
MAVLPPTSRRRIDTLLRDGQKRSTSLARLLIQASNCEARTAQLRALVPEDLRDQCLVVNLRDQVLTVHTSGAAWATRLRFLAPDLLPKLNRLSDFAPIREIRVRVTPPAVLSEETPTSTRRPQSPDGAALNELATSLDYGELRDAILRLARHAITGDKLRTSSHSKTEQDLDAADRQP